MRGDLEMIHRAKKTVDPKRVDREVQVRCGVYLKGNQCQKCNNNQCHSTETPN